MKFREILERLSFWKTADRLGADIPLTHWRLHFKSTMVSLCQQKFKYFANSAEFRPGAYAMYCSNISIGDRVIIRPGCALMADAWGAIVIEDGVMLGAGVHIYVNNHRFDLADLPIIDQGYYPSKSVLLKKGCWIGANAILLPGVTIGENAVVGAGSVVTRDVPNKTVVVGNPARIIRTIGVT